MKVIGMVKEMDKLVSALTERRRIVSGMVMGLVIAVNKQVTTFNREELYGMYL